MPATALKQLRDEVEMALGLCPEFDADAFRAGHQTPVYFGSALNNFGVRELLHGIAALAPPPRPQPAQGPDGPHLIRPEAPEVAGFVFKVQANIDPQHRDRIAFVRLASGRFQRGMKLKNIRTGRVMSVQAPVFFLARERNLAEEAWPGDIIGIPNHGSLRIGDTLTEGAEIRVSGIPSFAPEILRRVRVDDPMKTKHLRHALEQLAEEGVTRVFKPASGGDWIIGVVGALQLDVLTARLAAEYGLATRLDGAPYQAARWLESEDPAELERFRVRNPSQSAADHDGVPVFLARNAWDLRTTVEEWPKLRFTETRQQVARDRAADAPAQSAPVASRPTPPGRVPQTPAPSRSPPDIRARDGRCRASCAKARRCRRGRAGAGRDARRADPRPRNRGRAGRGAAAAPAP